MELNFIYIITVLLSFVPYGINSDPSFWEEEVEVIDQYETVSGYYLYIPKQKLSSEVIVFMHGYGGLNPMIYGAWIKHLVLKGHIVIYPRYQESIYSPGPKEFAINSAKGINAALNKLRDNKININDQLHYVGHSYGAAISAYIGVNFQILDLESPKSLMLCQPGTGPLKGLKLDSYNNLNKDIPFVVLVGEKDMTVGESLGKTIYQSTEDSEWKLFVRHYEDKSVEPPITATHYEPYSLDMGLDNEIINYTAKRALDKAKLDEVDTLYWNLFDALIEDPQTLFDTNSTFTAAANFNSGN